MGIFDSSKKIYTEGFKKDLKADEHLSETERKHAKGVFGESLKKGMSEYEIKKEVNRLKQAPGDKLGAYEVGQLRKKLKEHFK